MKKLIYIIYFFVLTSCDPPYILIVENLSNSNIDFKISTSEPIKFDSLSYSDSLLDDNLINTNSISKHFTKSMAINLIDSKNYSFTLKPNNELLISPTTIGLPFEKVTYVLNGDSFVLLDSSGFYNQNIELTRKPLLIQIAKIK